MTKKEQLKVDTFVARCKELQVPRSMLSAACHQVINNGLTMIVVKKDTGDIHMWFKAVWDIRVLDPGKWTILNSGDCIGEPCDPTK